jgi:hypothetical protein
MFSEGEGATIVTIERVLAAVLLAGAVAGAAAIPRLLVGPGGAPGVLLVPDAGGTRTIVHAAPAPPRPVRTLPLPRTLVPAHVTLTPAAVLPATVIRQRKAHAPATPQVRVAEKPAQPQAAPPPPAVPAAPVSSPAPAQPAPPQPVRVIAAVKVDHGFHRGRDKGKSHDRGKGHGHPAPPVAPEQAPEQAAVQNDTPGSPPAAPEKGDHGHGHDHGRSARMDPWHGSGDSAQAPSASPSPPGTSGGDSHHGRGAK